MALISDVAVIDGLDLPYRVGGLLYMPAFQENIVGKIAGGAMPWLTSVAFCLEDSIRDEAVLQAEASLHKTLAALSQLEAELPLIFIRIRSPEHMAKLHTEYADVRGIITGYILPKFDLGNAADYIRVAEEESRQGYPTYIMPVLESAMIADAATRVDVLMELRRMLDEVRPLVLNVRVGGNDFSNLYGLRRSVHNTIYDIGVVRDILMDILNIFASGYIVSGPVWNYFGDSTSGEWAAGLRRELELDRQNGFIGKTAIHPAQLPLIYDSLRVEADDYADAKAIIGWKSGTHGVAKSIGGGRMNEVKCHLKWAERCRILGDIYGVRKRES